MRIRKSYRLPAVTVEKIEWLEQILPAENQTHVIELAIAHLWQAERNKRIPCPDCGAIMAYYPGHGWICGECDN